MSHVPVAYDKSMVTLDASGIIAKCLTAFDCETRGVLDISKATHWKISPQPFV